MRLPHDFTKDGLLPSGDYDLTVKELKSSMLVKGPDTKSKYWDTTWRKTLVGNLEIQAVQLWTVGIKNIFC